MERVLRGDEKIRKAEEIYYRRQMGLPSNSKTHSENKKTYLWSKILLELLILLNLSLIIVAVQNKDFIFTEEFLNTVYQYNINLSDSIKSLLSEDIETNVVELEEGKNNSENSINVNNDQNEDNMKQKVSSAEENNTTDDENMEQNISSEEAIVPNEEEVSSLSQMDLDVDEIKKSCTFERPIAGTVTSIFGARESKYQNVRGYHTGIDIGAEKETSIKAAHSGTVVLVSSQGDYGKHLKIENGKIQSLYAHCSKILVKEGDYIESGQEIAKVRKYRKFNRSTFTF